MPLHADNPVLLRLQLHAFNGSVQRPSRHAQLFAGTVDRLVMTAVYLHLRCTSQFLQATPFHKCRSMLEIFAGRACRKVCFSVLRSARVLRWNVLRSEEHTSELQSHSFISYAVFCLKKKKTSNQDTTTIARTDDAAHAHSHSLR